MNREEFDKILRDSGVPEIIFDNWWYQWIKYNGMFNLGCQKTSLEFFVKTAVEKGCCASAPW